MAAAALALQGFRRLMGTIARHADLVVDTAEPRLGKKLATWKPYVEASTYVPGEPWHEAARAVALGNDVLAAHLGPYRERLTPWAVDVNDSGVRHEVLRNCAELVLAALRGVHDVARAVVTASADHAELRRAARALPTQAADTVRVAIDTLAGRADTTTGMDRIAAPPLTGDDPMQRVLAGASLLAHHLTKSGTPGNWPASLALLRLGANAAATTLTLAGDDDRVRAVRDAVLRLVQAQAGLPLLSRPPAEAVQASLAVRNAANEIRTSGHEVDRRLLWDVGCSLAATCAEQAVRGARQGELLSRDRQLVVRQHHWSPSRGDAVIAAATDVTGALRIAGHATRNDQRPRATPPDDDPDE